MSSRATLEASLEIHVIEAIVGVQWNATEVFT